MTLATKPESGFHVLVMHWVACYVVVFTFRIQLASSPIISQYQSCTYAFFHQNGITDRLIRQNRGSTEFENIAFRKYAVQSSLFGNWGVMGAFHATDGDLTKGV